MSKHLVTVALTVAICFLSSQVIATDQLLRYDGVYQTPKFKDGVFYFKYLRFYPDGLVTGVSTPGKPEQIQKWFLPENANISTGKYSVDGNRISFSLKSSAGVVDFSGELAVDQIRLYSRSKINQNEGEEMYSFLTTKTEQTAQ